jgi:hypothetical protein
MQATPMKMNSVQPRFSTTRMRISIRVARMIKRSSICVLCYLYIASGAYLDQKQLRK